ncbi:hypothetical protein PG996_008962 [Apiospora saccharicola]|uniref:Uncharacterized protein n=1 Tax=Apiospora saccharicola TaxID=335842 RepID=A0ABR1V211_9PEZI
MLEKLPEYMTRGLGAWMQAIQRPVLRELEPHAERIGIHDVEVLSSYNWVSPDYPPTIMVPGGPRVLRKDIGAVQLEKPTRELRDLYPTSTRLPLGAPTQPMFQAVRALRPECRFDNVDVVTSRIVLTMLLNFCKWGLSDFRLNATVVNDSLILEHCPKWTSMLAKNGSGYGFNFEEYMTAYPEGLEASDSHWRILRYKLGPMTWVIHYESDATKEPYGRFDSQKPVVIPARDHESATVVLKGHLTPQEETIEIKSKNGIHRWTPIQVEPAIWAGCTGHLLLGRLHQGMVEEVKIGDYRERNESQWFHKFPQHRLHALPLLIRALTRGVRKAPSGQAGLVFRAHPWERVEVFDADPQQGPIVSQEMRETFWGPKRRKRVRGGSLRGESL